jgi:hypothetical protein
MSATPPRTPSATSSSGVALAEKEATRAVNRYEPLLSTLMVSVAAADVVYVVALAVR